MTHTEWPPFSSDLYPLIGEEAGRDPEDFEDYLNEQRCGWCGRLALFSPYPEGWRPGELDEGHKPSSFSVLYQCTHCGRPHLVVKVIERGPDGVATLREMRPPRIVPTSVAPRLEVELYRGTLIEQLRAEAWADFYAGRRRSAAVMARATLQAMVRRYLTTRAFFKKEVDQLAELAGAGWQAVGGNVKDFADQWAHPDPSHPDPPTVEEAREVLERMDQVLMFTAAMEAVGHLRPATGDDSAG
jgi:hypothetical protein